MAPATDRWYNPELMSRVLNETGYCTKSCPQHGRSHRNRLVVAAAVCWLGTMGVAFGQTWSRSWGVNQYVRVLIADPVTPATLYAGGVNDASYPDSGVFKTIDGGVTW